MKPKLQVRYGTAVPIAFAALGGGHVRTSSASAALLLSTDNNSHHHTNDCYITRQMYDKKGDSPYESSSRIPRPFLKHSQSVPRLFASINKQSSNFNDEVPSLVSEKQTQTQKQQWMKKGLLISSFTEGLKVNQKAHSFLRKELLTMLLNEKKIEIERAMKDSVIVSPCNGPDISIWNEMDKIDEILEMVHECCSVQLTNEIRNAVATLSLPPIRIAYVPTASYALRMDSENTPGKQKQRSRADCKARRDDIVRFLYDENIINNQQSVLSVTIDFDDGSMKHPEINTSSNTVKKGTDIDKVELKTYFPRNGKEALQTWKPHVLYVQGGNTFWLHHCITKGEWEQDIKNLVTNNNGNNNNNCIYIGGSAGAIVTGSTIETACWKQMDDPRIVPGKTQYDDWKGVSGLQLLGTSAIFPHYDENLWYTIVKDGETYLKENNNITTLSVRQTDVYIVNGDEEKYTIV